MSRSIRLTGGLLHLSDTKGSADHFGPGFFIAAAMLQPFPPGLWLSFLPALSLVPLSAFSCRRLACASQPLPGYSQLLSSWLLSAQPWPWFPPPWHGSCCWPALPCWGIAPEHSLPRLLPWGSAADQTPSPPGSLRCISPSLISRHSVSFILVFSAGYNLECNICIPAWS